MRRGWPMALMLVGAFAGLPATAGAATFTVNTTADTAPTTPATECPDGSGLCSLPQAVDKADQTTGDDTINFNLPAGSTITLSTNGTLTISPMNSSDKLDIVGPGASNLTIAGANNMIVMRFNSGTNSLSGVTVTGGAGMHSLQGAGIDKGGGTLALNGVVVTGNTNDANGSQAAGGILNVSGMMTIRNSTISNNTVNNAGTGGGGGVVSHPGDILIVNSTISGNQVHGSSSDTGGGLWNALFAGTMTLVNVTVSNNSSDNGTGGLQNEDTVNLANTIIAQNSGKAAVDCKTAPPFGSTTSQGYNLLGSADGCSITPAAGDKFGTNGSQINAKLGGLTNNGGPTPTQALLQGSPAINGGNPGAVSDTEPPADPPALVACRTTDQRGIVRPQLGTCDIGAYEYAPGVASATAPPCSQNGLVTVTVTPPQGGFAQAVHYQIDGGPEQRAPTQNNQVTVLVPQGAHTLTYWAESQGGDQELMEHNLAVRVDNTPPLVRIRSDQHKVTYRKGQFASVTITASDANSALTENPSRRRLRISTSRLGRRTIRATAVDSCANSATATFTYRVVAAGQRPARRRRGGRPRFTG
jgi:hypothetical protein